MSWDGYIDSLKGYAGGAANCDKGWLIGLDNGGIWTTSHEMTQEQATSIARVLKSNDFTLFQTSGIKLGDTKYQFLRQEDDGKTVMAKKKDMGSLTFEKTKTAIIIGHCPEGGQQGLLNSGIAKIAEYLESVGY